MSVIQAPRGTMDVLPGEAAAWEAAESALKKTAETFGFGEIRFPTFEYTELFARGVGDTTDVVQKEMYTFEDRGGRSVTLRPEGTASTVRAVLQNGLQNGPMPLRLFYLISCFRGERPQAGRLREFHQFGAEMFGAAQPAADAELIDLAASALRALGIEGLELRLNSIGCPDCRRAYYRVLLGYLNRHKDELCPTCRQRMDRNPMRVLDCKEKGCQAVAAGAPRMVDYLCGDCKAHFIAVKDRLGALGIGFTLDPTIVRGLDYYTRTVFEFVDPQSGLTACGGGRYDGLVETLGGPKLPALGFGMGLERLMMVRKSRGVRPPEPHRPELYIAALGDAAGQYAQRMAAGLRARGVEALCDFGGFGESRGRSVKAQMKYADKLGARFAVVLGENELQSGRAGLRDMQSGAQRPVELDKLAEALRQSGLRSDGLRSDGSETGNALQGAGNGGRTG